MNVDIKNKLKIYAKEKEETKKNFFFYKNQIIPKVMTRNICELSLISHADSEDPKTQ